MWSSSHACTVDTIDAARKAPQRWLKRVALRRKRHHSVPDQTSGRRLTEVCCQRVRFLSLPRNTGGHVWVASQHAPRPRCQSTSQQSATVARGCTTAVGQPIVGHCCALCARFSRSLFGLPPVATSH
jgi:hypothetical protein